jgi:hypothetical protein
MKMIVVGALAFVSVASVSAHFVRALGRRVPPPPSSRVLPTVPMRRFR